MVLRHTHLLGLPGRPTAEGTSVSADTKALVLKGISPPFFFVNKSMHLIKFLIALHRDALQAKHQINPRQEEGWKIPAEDVRCCFYL